MGAGESWGKGRCRSQGAPGPCSDMCGAGEGSGGGQWPRGRGAVHLRRVRSSRPTTKNPARGGRCQSLCWLRSPQPNVLGAQGGGQPPQSRGERE